MNYKTEEAWDMANNVESAYLTLTEIIADFVDGKISRRKAISRCRQDLDDSRGVQWGEVIDIEAEELRKYRGG